MNKHGKHHLIRLHRPPTLLEVLQPRFYQGDPKRSAVTTTVIQLDIDRHGHLDAGDFPECVDGKDGQRPRHSGQRSARKRPAERPVATCGERP